MEWLEAEGVTVEEAVQAAVAALGLDSAEQVTVEVLREPKRGFLGLGSQLALVKVVQKPRKRRRRGRGRDKSQDREASKATAGKPQIAGKSNRGNGSRQKQPPSKKPEAPQRSKGDNGAASRPERDRGKPQDRKTGPAGKPDSGRKRSTQEAAVTEEKSKEDGPKATIEEQATVAVEFLEGLVDAFGLDGTVTSRIDDEILYLDVSGDTEALVGGRGVIMQSVLELTRTVVQRKTFGAPRMRLDIAGYSARRREALGIYAGRLAERVLADGGEVMLEPMNPADRKVVHDAIAAIDGVRSFSEGEEPNRSVIVAPTES